MEKENLEPSGSKQDDPVPTPESPPKVYSFEETMMEEPGQEKEEGNEETEEPFPRDFFPYLREDDRRGRILYGTPGKSFIPYLIGFFFLLILPLTFYNPAFLYVLVLLALAAGYQYYFVPGEKIMVYEKGIYIPISRFESQKHLEEHQFPYKSFVAYRDIEFFYPRSFRLSRNILIPHGLTIKTPAREYHVSHEVARVISKKLRAALKDEFSRLYKGNYCVYSRKTNWDQVEKEIANYPETLLRSIGLAVSLFAGVFGLAAFLIWTAGHSLTSFNRRLVWVLLLDSAIVAFYLSRTTITEFFKGFHNAVFKTWQGLQRTEKVPAKVESTYKRYVRQKITRVADVLEIFELDRRTTLKKSLIINLALLIQAMLIVSALPSELFLWEGTDYSESEKVLTNEPVTIDQDTTIENEELYVTKFLVEDRTLTFRNSTIYGLGGVLLDVKENGKIIADNSSFMTLDFTNAYRSYAGKDKKNVMEKELFVPSGSRLEFLTQYSMDYGFDFGYVEISRDGENWTQLEGEHSTTHRNEDAEVGHKGSPAYTGTRSWVEESVSLSGFSGTVKLRFTHVTDGHRSVTSPYWNLWNIRLVWEGGVRHLNDTWQTYGWTQTGSVLSSHYWMDIQGNAEFTNCSFLSRGTGIYSLVDIHAGYGELRDCSFDIRDGFAVWLNSSTAVMERLYIMSDQGIWLTDSNLTITDSVIALDSTLDTLRLSNSYVIMENTSLVEGPRYVSPSDVTMDAESGLAVMENATLRIHSILPNGSLVPGVPVRFKALHGSQEITGTTDQEGFFSARLFSGYELYGSNEPWSFFDELLLRESDVYRITVGNRDYYHYIGEDSYLSLVTGDAADLLFDLSSFTIEPEDNGSRVNLSLDILNQGNMDAPDFSVRWWHSQQTNIMDNLSLPVGERMRLNLTVNADETVELELDSTNSVLEYDELNNQATFNTGPGYVELSGDYMVEQLNSSVPLTISGNLVIIGGELVVNETNGTNDLLTVNHHLYLENCKNSGPRPLSIECRYGNSYLFNCDLPSTTLRSGRDTQVQSSILSSLYSSGSNPTSLLVKDSELANIMTSYSHDPFMSIIEDNTLHQCTLSGDKVVMRNNTITEGNGAACLILESGYFYILDNTIGNSQTGLLSGLYSTGKVLRNRISDCAVGTETVGNLLDYQENTIEDCGLGIRVKTDSYEEEVEDIAEQNTFKDCQRQLEYHHRITISILAENHRYLRNELQELVKDKKLDSNDFTIILESETSVIGTWNDTVTSYIDPELLHYYLDKNGTIGYPVYYISVYKQFYGFHHSSFSEVEERTSVIVSRKGDATPGTITIEPLDDTTMILAITATAIGANMSNVKIGVFDGDKEIKTEKISKLIAGEDSVSEIEVPLEPGVHTYSVRIVSKDIYPRNNEISRKARLVTSQETMAGQELDYSIVVAKDGELTVSGGNLHLNQSRDNEHEIQVFEGGTLKLAGVEVSSDHLYALTNHGTVECTDTSFQQLGSEVSLSIEDAWYPDDLWSQGDPYLQEPHSGILNSGELVLQGCTVKAAGIYSDGHLVLEDTFMTGGYGDPDYQGDYFQYPSIFSTGELDISNSNISYYKNSLFLYTSDFTISGSSFVYSSVPSAALDLSEGWGHHDGGILSLRSTGSFQDCVFKKIGLDLRNSTVEIRDNFLDDYHHWWYNYPFSRIIARNCNGTITGNQLNSHNSGYSREPVLTLKNSTGLSIKNNDFNGVSTKSGIECYWSSPEIRGNTFRNLGIGIASYAQEIDPGDNVFINSSESDYSQKYLLNLSAEDGSGHTVHNLFAEITQGNTSHELLFDPDSLYSIDYLLELYSQETDYLLAWVEGYHIMNTTKTTADQYSVSLYKKTYYEKLETNFTLTMTGNMEKRVVLPMPDLGLDVKKIRDLTVDRYEEILITVYNNGSRDAEDVTVDIRIIYLNTGATAHHSLSVLWLPANSSGNVSLMWKPEDTKMRIEFEVSMGKGVETSEANNIYTTRASAKRAEDGDEDGVTAAFRGLILFIVILGLIVLGYFSLSSQMKEKTDAMGVNFDAEEFRKSLKAAGAGEKKAGSPDEKPLSTDQTKGGDGGKEPGEEHADAGSDTGPDDEDEFLAPEPVPGTDICPVCRVDLMEPDEDGVTSCFTCGWMKFERLEGHGSEPVVPDTERDN